LRAGNFVPCSHATFVFRWIITTVAVMVVPVFINGIRYDTPGVDWRRTLLGILNAFVRPCC
jgi:uncharacterized membrane protein YvlD (DUF360 family)